MASIPPTRQTLAPETLMKVKHLELRAKMVVEGFMSGLHRSPYHGFSVEFTDYRQYSPGDDLRYLDWKLLARRDRQYIKRFEDETNLRCHLLVDLSRSMSFGRTGYSKFEYARTLAATLAWFFNRQRDAVGLLTFGDRIVDMIPPRFRTGHLRRLMVTLESSTPKDSTDIAVPLEQIARTVTKRALVILISDLLTPVEPLEANLGYLKARGHDVIVMRVLDPAEVNFDFSQASLFRDIETQREFYVDPQAIGEDYRKRFHEHAAEVEQVCQHAGIDLFTIQTDQPVETALLDLVQARSGAPGASARRRPGSTGGRR